MAYTPLYDYKAHEPVLLGGTHSQFSIDDGVSWLALRGAQELGDIGDIAESQDPRNAPLLMILATCTQEA